MFHPLPIFVGLRYVRTRRQGFFVSFISWVSMLGVAVGVTALITIISVMNGFEGELRSRLVALTAHATVEGAPGRVVLDLSGVGFIDSSGLGAVVAARRFLREGQALDLAGLTAPVARVFRLTRMDMLFAIHPEVADALRETA